jgi:hypothetical protein
MTIACLVTTVQDVRPHGDNLTIVTVDGNEVVANKREDGSPRWAVGEECVYIPEGAIIPEDVLRERGYWDTEKDRGLLAGGKRNRVKMQRFAGHESRGLLFKLHRADTGMTCLYALEIRCGQESLRVRRGDDVAEFLGITEMSA